MTGRRKIKTRREKGYIQKKGKEYNLSCSALVMFDQFKGQLTETFLKFSDSNNILVTAVEVPPHCTDQLQPLDLVTVNLLIKLGH